MVQHVTCNTVDMERFAGLNIHGFSPMKFLRKYFCGALATSVHYLPIAKNSRENFRSKLKNRKSLAQRLFPHLQYYSITCESHYKEKCDKP